MANHSRGPANNRWKGGPQEGICIQCGSTFKAPRWELKKRKFCSRECYAEYKVIPISRKTRTHVLMVERILGRRLPESAVVHHVNRNRKDNRNQNFVVCQDQAYHMLLHARTRVVQAGGNPRTDKVCSRCKKVKPKTEFHKSKSKDGYRCYCKPCQSEIYYERRYGNGTRIENHA
jgi:hypothetical protein